MLQPLAAAMVPVFSRQVRKNTRLNAVRIFGTSLGPAEQRKFTRSVVSSFYEFILDIGRARRESLVRMLARVDHVDGEPEYHALRRSGRGAVLVTAHLGSFEIGLAALARIEQRVHVVFKRDASSMFEAMRADLRRKLGVIESPIDDGLATWMNLRNALGRGEVVVMQGDRAMPGQRSAVIRFLHGHLRVPTGAVRLARLTSCPIIPVFTVRQHSGLYTVHLHPAIEPSEFPHGADADDPCLNALTRSIESIVALHPTQWLALGAAFEEDVAHA